MLQLCKSAQQNLESRKIRSGEPFAVATGRGSEVGLVVGDVGHEAVDECFQRCDIDGDLQGVE